MSNRAIDILIELIKESEGCKLRAYKCPAGVWTIGYGCTGAGITEGLTWDQEQADQSVKDMAIQAHKSALKASPCLAKESANKQAAIADFIYNLGSGAYRASILKKRVDALDWSSAQSEIIRWNKANLNGKSTVLPGLVARRKKECDLLAR